MMIHHGCGRGRFDRFTVTATDKGGMSDAVTFMVTVEAAAPMDPIRPTITGMPSVLGNSIVCDLGYGF